MLAVIQIVGLNSGEPTGFDGEYLVDYDPQGYTVYPSPDGEPIFARIVTTPDQEKAKKYTTYMAIWEELHQSFGSRPDGRPNRPITAFHLAVIPLDEESANVRP